MQKKLNVSQQLRRRLWHASMLTKHLLAILYDTQGVRTITRPPTAGSVTSSELRTELQTLENEVAAPSSGHLHAGTDSRLVQYGDPNTTVIGDTAASGTAGSFVRADHRHGVAGGATSVTQAFNDAPNTGSALTYARIDHRHGMPAAPAGLLSGTVILWTGGSCPSGWSRVTSIDGRFLVSSSSFNSQGGSNTVNPSGSVGNNGTHSHTPSSHNHTLSNVSTGVKYSTSTLHGHESGTNDLVRFSSGGSATSYVHDVSTHNSTTGSSTGSTGDHAHTLSLSQGLDNKPVYATILLCQKN